ncbi:hypothetical protein IFM89_003197 [Coptis chinensis]|uniref:Protein NDH-DEPENDENT CYCLIC ELECTRON FLOW 5 n=1 Tax=Coptis chinensis TaxID=261450 RepID=A0A835H298_9MAGN|nr:hypothetical protein IFM89_003197 [Coptis chinensis]
MAMANISHRLFSPSFTPLVPTCQTKHPFNSYQLRVQRDFSVLAMASSSFPLNNVEHWEREFKDHGVSFAEIGDSCVVRMRLDNGSVASLMLPSGLITAYKAHMWHGSTLEVLHTIVSEGEDGAAVIQGGMFLDFRCTSQGGVPWSPGTWVLHDVRGTAEDFIEAELVSRNSEDMVEVKHIVTLHPDVLSSEVVITNYRSSALQVTGSLLSHLSVSTPDATYAVGLEGSNYFSKPPFVSDYTIIPPVSESRTTGAFQGLFSSRGKNDQNGAAELNKNTETEEELEGEEKDNYAQLTEEMSRIYTSAPRQFTFIDRGKRNSVAVGSSGFEELYIFSPGSNYELYGKYAYICTGPSAVLKPIVLNPKGVWRGEHFLHNPNL